MCRISSALAGGLSLAGVPDDRRSPVRRGSVRSRARQSMDVPSGNLPTMPCDCVPNCWREIPRFRSPRNTREHGPEHSGWEANLPGRTFPTPHLRTPPFLLPLTNLSPPPSPHPTTTLQPPSTLFPRLNPSLGAATRSKTNYHHRHSLTYPRPYILFPSPLIHSTPSLPHPSHPSSPSSPTPSPNPHRHHSPPPPLATFLNLPNATHPTHNTT